MRLRYHMDNAFSFCVLLSFFTFVLVVGAPQEIKCPIQSLYQLGDSISDTGHVIRIAPNFPPRPYGETFPGYTTAMTPGLPLLNPYLARTASFDNGVNFAVAGSTALSTSFYYARGIIVLPLPNLSAQRRWFMEYLNSTCSTSTACAGKLSKSFVFVGEIGYNDIAFAVSQRRSLQEIRAYLPLVVEAIINTTREVINAGSSQVVVPGTFPLGCFPFALSARASQDPTSYDDLGCLKGVNNLTNFLNNQLQQAPHSLRNEFPDIIILYADYDNAFRSFLRNAPNLGFDTKTLLNPCCGVEGSLEMFCGSPGAPLCPDPKVYIHWDDIHLTQEAYRRISEILIKDLKIKCASGKNLYEAVSST